VFLLAEFDGLYLEDIPQLLYKVDVKDFQGVGSPQI
jgi:hypothetical protein